MNRFLDDFELEQLELSTGYKIGKNVKIARNTVIDCNELEIGDNTIISDFTILTGRIKIGRYCHIAHKVHLSGHYNITIGNHVTISANTTIYTESDDHKGHALIGPQVPYEFRSCYSGPVFINDFVAIGTHCIIMPNSIFGEGSMLNIRSNAYNNFRAEPWMKYGSYSPISIAQLIKPREQGQKDLVDKL